MPVQEVPITSIADIPALAATFAAANGWAVSGTSQEPVFRRADDAAALSFRLVASGAGVTQRLTLDGSFNGVVSVTSRAAITVPVIKSGSSGAAQAANRLTMIAGAGPYLAIVVGFNGGYWRHLYLGNLLKIGNYTGGEIIGGSSFQVSRTGTGTIAYDAPDYAHLFSANADADRTVCGGVRISHNDNSVGWREFRRNAVSWTDSFFDPAMVLGGWQDAINSGTVARGNSSYAGRSILTPINLFAASGGKNLIPIGTVPGIRMIDIRDIDPATSFAIGSETWRVFPAFRKSGAGVSSYEDGIALDESSFRLGYAYRTA